MPVYHELPDSVYFEKIRKGSYRCFDQKVVPRVLYGIVVKLRHPAIASRAWAFFPVKGLSDVYSYGGVSYGHSRKYAVSVYLRGIHQDLSICMMHPERNYSRVRPDVV